jgi:drug/metabolite transporter (DMT)-like permease
MGLALGFTAALCWGVNDYFIAVASRRTGVFRVVAAFHVIATVALAVVVLGSGGIGEVPAERGAVLAVVGAVGGAAYLSYFKALAIGPISVISPIISGYGTVTLLLAVVLLGDRLSGAQTTAVLVAWVGVALASTDPRRVAGHERVQVTGVVFAMLTMVLLGAFVFGISLYAEEIGWLAPIFIARALTCLLLVLAAVRGAQWRLPDPSVRAVGLIALVGLLDTAGYVSFNVGVQHAETALVAAASAPYAVVPVLMGVALFRERPAASQWVGVLAVLAGLVALGAVS